MLMFSQIMRVPSSRRRTSRSLIISGSNIRDLPGAICRSRISQQDLAKFLRTVVAAGARKK